ncbi:MAG: pentapeptide repeat-containing protein [Anaerolineae bacterium]|nr:pentapeptide repeat-containing protein [Anaerolineae bacterium]
MAQTSLTSHEAYAGVTFKRLSLTHEFVLNSEFSECKFVRCDFSETHFQNCRFIECAFEDCTMKMTTVGGTTFARVRFSRCNLLGVNWTDANWSEWATKISALAFDGCDLKYAVFLGLKLKGLTMTACNATEANFAEADLTEANFDGTDFAGAIFLHTDLTRANFAGARHYTINLNDNRSQGARFALPEALRLLFALDIVIVDPETNEDIGEDRMDDYVG